MVQSIDEQLNTITQDVADTYTALGTKGATLPAKKGTSNLKATVDSLPKSGFPYQLYSVDANGRALQSFPKTFNENTFAEIVNIASRCLDYFCYAQPYSRGYVCFPNLEIIEQDGMCHFDDKNNKAWDDRYVDGFVQVGVDSTGKAHCYIPEVDEANNNGVQAATVNYVKKSLDTKQDTLTAGTGISIQDNVISSTVNSATWGNITGTLTDQTDLKEALDAKQPTGDYATTAQLPTKVSQLTNDAGYITSAQVPAGLTVSYSSASEELVFTSDSTLQASLANIISGE